jgi:NAD-dependent SIR2 family protein deacetylase
MISEESAIPYCPYCGAPLHTAFRAFEGYKHDERRYHDWIESSIKKRLCIIELGVGFNTPGVIRRPFELLTYTHEQAHLFRINREYKEWPGHGGYPMVPPELKGKATSIPFDAKDVLECLYQNTAALCR